MAGKFSMPPPAYGASTLATVELKSPMRSLHNFANSIMRPRSRWGIQSLSNLLRSLPTYCHRGLTIFSSPDPDLRPLTPR